tara:strand:+ start:5407 stop:5574 length:168 start_codon:yes stop_codon:yes gene_type:complete
MDLKEVKEKLKEEEYKWRWGGYPNPYLSITSAQYTVVSYWRKEVEKLEKLEQRVI